MKKNANHDQNKTKNYDLKAKVYNFLIYIIIIIKYLYDILNKNAKQVPP